MNDVVIASSEADARAAEAVEEHHAQMAGALALKVESLSAAARARRQDNADEVTADLVTWCRGELVPHALAEEGTLYRVAAERVEARLLVEAMLAEVGRRSARVADVPVFVLNRLQYVLLKEAMTIVEEGVATPTDIDTIVSTTFGFRLPFFGPFAIADMAGLDVYANGFTTLENALGERLTRNKVAGVACATAGAIVVIASAQSGAALSSQRLIGDLLMVGGAACWSVYATLGAITTRTGSPLGVTAVACLAG